MTSHRAIKRKKQQGPAIARYPYLAGNVEDEYEIDGVVKRKVVTFGVDVASQADWLNEAMTGRAGLPGFR